MTCGNLDKGYSSMGVQKSSEFKRKQVQSVIVRDKEIICVYVCYRNSMLRNEEEKEKA